jgi:MFS family permease
MVTGALQHRNFRLFFTGYLFSLTGTWMQWVTQMWLIFKLTDSAFMIGCLSFASNTPIFLLAPLGGAIADRLPRRSILLTTQTIAMVLALALALLTLKGDLRAWHLLVFALLFGINNAFDIPTHQAFVADLVERGDLMNAIALNSFIINITRIVGPALAGLLLSGFGAGWCFLFNSVSFVPALAAILLMTSLPRRQQKQTQSPFRDIAEGLAHTRDHPFVRYVLLLIGLLGLVGMSYTVLLPVQAEQVLGAGPKGFGSLVGATGAGALLAVIIFARYRNVPRLAQWIFSAALVFGVGMVLLSLSSSFWFSLILVFVLGFSQVVQLDAANKLLQVTVPAEMRGRIMSLYILVMMGMTPTGALLAGGLARRFGLSSTLLCLGLFYLLCGLLLGLRLLAANDFRSQLSELD